MKLLIRDGHVVERIAHELTDADLHDIFIELTEAGLLDVEVVADALGEIHLWPHAPVTTAQEVTVLRAVKARTDAPVAWHGAVAGG